MDEHFGAAYAQSWAQDTVLSELGGRTVAAALDQGAPAKDVWRGVVAHLGLPAARR